MNIVFVDTVLSMPPPGGAHTFLVDLCTALATRGDSVTVVTQPGPDQTLIQLLRSRGVVVRDDIWRATDLPPECATRLASWVNSNRTDIYVVSISADAGWLALPLLGPHVGTVSIAHSNGRTFYDPLKHYAQFIDCAVGVSEETTRQIISYCGVPAERARQIPYGVTSIPRAEIELRASRLASQKGPLQIGYVGRIVHSQKRVLDLIPLAQELSRRATPFKLHVIGEGPERAQLEKGFKSAGLEPSVKFWGWLEFSGVKQRLRELDVLVLLSDCEGLPVAMLEGMAQGVVPAATRIESGNGELVRDGHNGYLENVGDFTAFGERLDFLSHDRRTLAEMSRASWETAQAYTVARMVQRYSETFAEIASRGVSRVFRDGGGRDYPLMPSCVSRYPPWLRKIKLMLLAGLEKARALYQR